MILMVGATGLVGSATLRQLTARSVPVRALVRNAEKASTLAGPGVETVIGDLEQPASLDAALDGVTRALLISPLHPRQVEWQGNCVEVARRAGAVHIVKLSGLGTAPDSPLCSGRWHAQTERHIADAGLPFTYLQPPFFMQNLLRSAAVIAAQGVLVASMQAGKIAMVDACDVAAVAVAALTSDGHVGKTYTITGPEALSFHEVAQKLAAAAGRPVTYQDVPPWDPCRSRGWPSLWRSLSWWGPAPSAGACRRQWLAGSPALWDGRRSWQRCTGRWSGLAPGTGTWWRSSARPAWANRAWCTKWSTRTAPRVGWCSRAPRCPRAKPRRTSLCSTC